MSDISVLSSKHAEKLATCWWTMEQFGECSEYKESSSHSCLWLWTQVLSRLQKHNLCKPLFATIKWWDLSSATYDTMQPVEGEVKNQYAAYKQLEVAIVRPTGGTATLINLVGMTITACSSGISGGRNEWHTSCHIITWHQAPWCTILTLGVHPTHLSTSSWSWWTFMIPVEHCKYVDFEDEMCKFGIQGILDVHKLPRMVFVLKCNL